MTDTVTVVVDIVIDEMVIIGEIQTGPAQRTTEAKTADAAVLKTEPLLRNAIMKRKALVVLVRRESRKNRKKLLKEMIAMMTPSI